MPVRDDFAPDHPLPVFLSSRAEEYEEPEGFSWLRKVGLLAMAVAVIGIAMTLAFGDPMKIFSDVMASLTDNSAPQPAADQSAAPNQSTADTQTLAQTAAVQARDDSAAASPPQSESQADTSAPQGGALLQQFQNWAAAQDAQPQGGPAQAAQDAPAQIEPVRPIMQDAQTQAEPLRPTTQVMQDAPAPVRTARVHRKPRPVQNARAEIRPAKPPRAGGPPGARADARPQDGRPPDQPQQAQSPSFLQSIGLSPRQQQ